MLTKRIASAADLGLAVEMKAILESANIIVQELFSPNDISFAGADLNFFIEVFPQQAEAAQAILRDSGFEAYIITDT